MCCGREFARQRAGTDACTLNGRELGGIDDIMCMLQKPFQKGISIGWMQDSRFRSVREIGQFAYSVMRLCVKENESNAEVRTRAHQAHTICSS